MDARRLSALQSAPQVLYTTRDPPLELRNIPGLKKSEDMGYVTFGKFFLQGCDCPLSDLSNLPISSPLPSSLRHRGHRQGEHPADSDFQKLSPLPFEGVQVVYAFEDANSSSYFPAGESYHEKNREGCCY